MSLEAAADNNRVANPVADTGRHVFFSSPGPYSGQALWEIAQRYFSIEQYRLGNRLQLDSRISALLGAAADYKKRGCSYCVSANPTAIPR
jgi:hypothetical protein